MTLNSNISKDKGDIVLNNNELKSVIKSIHLSGETIKIANKTY